MPRTPRAVRPIGRTFSSRKRIAQPLRVPSRMSDAPSVMRTLDQVVVVGDDSAMMPEARMFANASSDVFLMHARARRHDDERPLGELAHGQERHDALALLQRDQVDERLALGGAARLRDLPDLLRVGAPLVGEHQQRVVRRRDEQLRDEVLLVRRRAGDAAPAAPLRAVERLRVALDVAAVGDGDDHLLGRDHVLDVDVAARRR